MSEAKFTSGDRYVELSSDGNYMVLRNNATSLPTVIGRFYSSGDANLDAAAPLLYEACKDVLPQLEACQDIRRARLVRAALTAADG